MDSDLSTRILAVAADLFGARGYEATALREIAERLDVTKAALYYHFPSKEAIATAIAAPVLADLEALAGEDRTGVELLRAYLDVLLAHHDAVRMIARDVSLLRHPEIGRRLEECTEAVRARLAATVGAHGDEIVASAALGALWRPVLQYDRATVVEHTDELLRAARAALGLTEGTVA